MTQGAQPSALWQPRGVGWGGSWEEDSQRRGHMYTCGWFSVDVWHRQTQHCKAITLQLKKKRKREDTSRNFLISLRSAADTSLETSLSSSTGKESASNAGESVLIPVSGWYAGKRIGYPLQYSWPSLVVQLVKNLPAMWRPGFDSWVRNIPCWSEPTPVFWPEEFHRLYSPWGCKESDTTERADSAASLDTSLKSLLVMPHTMWDLSSPTRGPGIGPTLPALTALSLNHLTTQEVPAHNSWVLSMC